MEPSKRIAELEDALETVQDLIEDYVDIIDGGDGRPAPNKAMRAVQLIDEALGRGGY